MNNLNSISLLFLFTTLFFSVNGITAIRSYGETIENLPAEKDFNFYLVSLEKAVNFYTRRKHYVDMNSAFGLFMVNVNLRSYLQLKPYYDIPVNIRSRLEKLMFKVDVLTDYFHDMVKNLKHVEKYGQEINIAELFSNKTTMWSKAPDRFNEDLLTKIFSPENLMKTYGKWENYLANVNKPEEFIPSPAESDECLQALALNSPSKSSSQYCRIPSHCKNSVEEGNDFGYSLSHNLLFLIMARFSRQCVVFSEKEDEHKTDTFCTKCFTEVQYIALNNFQLPDLVAENIALCGLLGHAQFYRKLWLKKLTHLQTSKGCFSDIITENSEKNQMREGKHDEWFITSPTNWIMNGQCNLHFTSVSIAVLSNTLRYIIETYY